MISGQRVLAVIPARGGSKGVPRKNIRNLAGKPLIAWTIEEAKKSIYIDRLVMSSEDAEIMQIARMYGCDVPFQRPIELARDDSPGIAPALHAVEALPGYDILMLLQPTSPLRAAEDMDGCIEELVKRGAPACISITEAAESPYWMYSLHASGAMQPLMSGDTVSARRQDLPQLYTLNGAVYTARCDWLLRHKTFLTADTVGFVMPNERSLDIDTELDLRITGALIGS